MSRPAGVGDATFTLQRRGGQQRFQIPYFSMGALNFERLSILHGYACGIVATVFQGMQSRNQEVNDITPRAGCDYAAHLRSLASLGNCSCIALLPSIPGHMLLPAAET